MSVLSNVSKWRRNTSKVPYVAGVTRVVRCSTCIYLHVLQAQCFASGIFSRRLACLLLMHFAFLLPRHQLVCFRRMQFLPCTRTQRKNLIVRSVGLHCKTAFSTYGGGLAPSLRRRLAHFMDYFRGATSWSISFSLLLSRSMRAN